MNLPKKRLRLQPSHFSVVTLIPQSSTKSGLNYNYYKLREAHFSTPINDWSLNISRYVEPVVEEKNITLSPSERHSNSAGCSKALKQTESHFLQAIYQASGSFLE
jgi:hypothetical protein